MGAPIGMSMGLLCAKIGGVEGYTIALILMTVIWLGFVIVSKQGNGAMYEEYGDIINFAGCGAELIILTMLMVQLFC